MPITAPQRQPDSDYNDCVLLKKAAIGDLWGVRDILGLDPRNFNVDARRDVDDATALIIASIRGYIEMVRDLLHSGADVNATKRGGETALFCAVCNGEAEIVKLLVDAGAGVNTRYYYGDTALCMGAQVGNKLANANIVRQLLLFGADVEAKRESGHGPLFVAAYHGNDQVVEALLQAGADIEARDGMSGQTALQCAMERGRSKAVTALLQAGANFFDLLDRDKTIPDDVLDLSARVTEQCRQVEAGLKSLLGVFVQSLLERDPKDESCGLHSLPLDVLRSLVVDVHRERGQFLLQISHHVGLMRGQGCAPGLSFTAVRSRYVHVPELPVP